MLLVELTSYLRMTIFILVQKKGINAISQTKFPLTEKVIFLLFSAYFNVFCLLFDENNEISRKSSKNELFR